MDQFYVGVNKSCFVFVSSLCENMYQPVAFLKITLLCRCFPIFVNGVTGPKTQHIFFFYALQYWHSGPIAGCFSRQ